MVTLSCSYASKIEQAIIAAAVCSRTGQIQCARTYLPIAFGRLEALVTSFPRQLEAGQQHRYVERRGTAVRFVFQSLDDYYVVILTNRSSNVIADLQAVAQFSAATADVAGRCQAPDGKIQLDQGACYDLLLAFDEIVSELGIAAISRDALHEALAMESHEEAVQEAILQTKAKEAKEAAKQKIKQLEMAKKEALRSTFRSRSGSTTAAPASPADHWAAPLVPSVNMQEERAIAEQGRTAAAAAASTKIRAMKLR